MVWSDLGTGLEAGPDVGALVLKVCQKSPQSSLLSQVTFFQIKTESTKWVVSRETKEENTTHVSFCFQECKHWSQQKVLGLDFLNLD